MKADFRVYKSRLLALPLTQINLDHTIFPCDPF